MTGSKQSRAEQRNPTHRTNKRFRWFKWQLIFSHRFNRIDLILFTQLLKIAEFRIGQLIILYITNQISIVANVDVTSCYVFLICVWWEA